MDGSTETSPDVSVAPVPAVAPAVTPAPTDAPVTTPAQRPLDTIHQELLDAKAAHAEALQQAAMATTLLTTLAAEYHAALTWFNQEEKTLLADIDDAKTSVGSWLMAEIKAI